MNPPTEPEAKRKGCGWTIFVVCALVCPLVLSVEESIRSFSLGAKVLILPAFCCVVLTFVGGMAARVITVPFLGWVVLPGLTGLVCHWCGVGTLPAAVVVDALLLAVVVDALLLAVVGIALFSRFKHHRLTAAVLAEHKGNPGPRFRRDTPGR